MSNPLRSLKYLPWSLLLQSAAVSVAIATILDYGITLGLSMWVQAQSDSVVPMVLSALFFATLAAAYGIGALSLLITRRFFREVMLTAQTIWALIGCVVLLYCVRTWFPVIPGLLMQADVYSIVLITLGAFFTGKRHWR